jgi:hypothetical protein
MPPSCGEQGVTFAVVVVKSHVVNSDSSRREAVSGFGVHFRGVPMLMVQDGRGRPTFWGRRDIVSFLPRAGRSPAVAPLFLRRGHDRFIKTVLGRIAEAITNKMTCPPRVRP